MREEDLEIEVVEIKKNLGREITKLFDKIILPKTKGVESPKIMLLNGSGPTKKFAKKIPKKVSKYSFTEPQEIKEADSETCTKLLELAQKENIVALLSVGGGKVLDVGKFVGSYHKKSVIVCPTSTTHDGICSSRAVIRKNGEYHRSINVNPPRAVILHWPWPESCTKTHPEYILSGLGDLSDKPNACADWLLTKVMQERGEDVKEETNFNKTKSKKSVDAFKEILDILKKKEEKGEAITPVELVKPVMHSLITCGKQMSSLEPPSARPASGPGHLISHALDKILPQPRLHGYQVGIGALISYYIREKYLDLDEKLYGKKPYGIGFEEVARAFKYARIPKHWKELGIDDGDMINAIVEAPEIGKDRWFNLFEYLKEDHKPKINIDGIFANEILSGIEERYKEMYFI